MTVTINNVTGIPCAMNAMRLSYGSTRKDNALIESEGLINEDKFQFLVHKDDFTLAKRLILKGDSHAKVMRMIGVWMDITAPRFWWAEFDTYKIGTTAMSESTMHLLMKRSIEQSDFEEPISPAYLDHLNKLRQESTIEEVKNALPEGYLQRRMVFTNYQTLRHIYFDRKYHKLPQWHVFIDKLKTLPFREFIVGEKE
jgi:hypothetical protein